jgi:Fe-S-cluster containining protein
MTFPGSKHLRFRCTGCGNCCKEPLLPLTDADVRRISRRTGDPARDIVRWVDRHGIDMDDEPEAFAILRQGKRVMVLRHERGGCRYLGEDNRCTIYSSRPLGCRVFPFDPDFSKNGTLRRLRIVTATEECPFELDGNNDVDEIRDLDERYRDAHAHYNSRVAEWNREQRKRRRAGKAAQTASEFLTFLGLGDRAKEMATKQETG